MEPAMTAKKATKMQEARKHLTADAMQPGPMKTRRDKFVTFMVMGYSKKEAGLMAGIPPKSVHKQTCMLWAEPYVQEQYKRLRDSITEEQIVCRKDIIIGLLQEARAVDDPNSNQTARVNAWMNIARIMGFEKPMKVDLNVQGGVMIVPMASNPDEWERIAAEQQDILKLDVKR